MRPITTAYEKLFEKNVRAVSIKVEIEDGDGNLIDITNFKDYNWVIGVDFGDSVDSECADANIRIKRSIYNDSMAPLNKKTRINKNGAGAWDPLLDLNREVVIYAQYASEFRNPGLGWIEVFRGGIDTVEWGSDVINVACRDQFRELQDTWVETETEYSDNSGNPVEDIMQEILDDVFGVGVITLYVPTSPGWNIKKFKAQRQSVSQQLLLLSDQIGWRLKYLWDSGTNAFRLTFVEPDRAKTTVDYTFDQERYYQISNLDVDISGVRNAITVTYPDSADLRSDGSPKKKSVTAVNAGSIALYGRRWMGVTEAASSNIDTSTEATEMATAMLSDLKTPRTSQAVEMPFFAHVELDDLYVFEANAVHYTTDPTFAVIGYRHTFEENRAFTTIQLREDTVTGKYLSWFHHSSGNGMGNRQRTVHADVKDARVTETNLGLQLDWEVDLPQSDHFDANILRDTFYEIDVTPPGGTPDFTNPIARVKSTTVLLGAEFSGILPVDELRDIHVRAVSRFGESAYVTVSNKKAKPVGSAGFDTGNTVLNEGFSTSFNEQTKGTDYPPDFWEMETGTWATDAVMDDGTVYSSVAPRYGSQFLLLK